MVDFVENKEQHTRYAVLLENSPKNISSANANRPYLYIYSIAIPKRKGMKNMRNLNPVPQKYRILTAFDLKIVACITMVLDHAAKIFSFQGIAKIICSEMIGRIAFPLFCLLLAEGYAHTRNARKYFFRLFICAILSEIPFNFMHGNLLEPKAQNTLFTLSLGIAVFCLADVVKKKVKNFEKQVVMQFLVVIAGVTIATFLFFDYRAAGILCLVCCHLFDQEKRADPFLAAVAGCTVLAIYGVREAGAFLCLPLVLFYSGEHGRQLEGRHKTAAKYAFYAFYPVHLIFLDLAAFFLK